MPAGLTTTARREGIAASEIKKKFRARGRNFFEDGKQELHVTLDEGHYFFLAHETD